MKYLMTSMIAVVLTAGPVSAHDGHPGGNPNPSMEVGTGTRYGTRLTPGAQVPGVVVPTTASGYASLVLNDDRSQLSVDMSFTRFSSPNLFAHIHCCAPATGNGPFAIDFVGFPVGTLTGSYSRTFDLNSLATFGGGFVAANGGSLASVRDAFLTGFEGGQAYVNIHSTLNPGGEVRGQIAAVPEPASWAMLIMGFGLTGAVARRRADAVQASEAVRAN